MSNNPERLPYACLHLAPLIKATAKIIEEHDYLNMPEGQFIGLCLKYTGGKVSPTKSKQMYHDLMKDAGLPALNSPLKSNAEDNGDHSWEYYVDGKTVSEEEFNTAHTSYFKA